MPAGPPEEPAGRVRHRRRRLRAAQVVDVDEIPLDVGRGGRQLGPQPGRVRAGQCLVGVQPEDPLAATVVERLVAGSGEVVVPVPLDDDRAGRPGDLDRVVDRTGVVDDDLIGDRPERRQAAGEVLVLVAHDEAGRHERRPAAAVHGRRPAAVLPGRRCPPPWCRYELSATTSRPSRPARSASAATGSGPASARAIPPAPSTSDRRTANDGPDSRDAGVTTPARPATSRRANDRWTSGSYGRYGTPTSSSSPSAMFVRAAAAATSGSPRAPTSPSVQPVVGTVRSSTTTTISWVGGRTAGRLSRRGPRTRQLPGSAGDRPGPTSTTSSAAASVSPRTSRKARVARRSVPARTAMVTGRRGISGGPPVDPGARPSGCLRTDPSAETGRGSSRELDPGTGAQVGRAAGR